MKKRISILLLTTIFAVSFVQAVSAGEDGAGCGIGKVILEGKSGKGPHIVAAILNDILIPRTLFMSTASAIGEPLLGCDVNKTVRKEEEKKIFVSQNMDRLSGEMAQGSGAHLEVLADLIGVVDNDKTEFFKMTQDEYKNLFSEENTSADQILNSLQVAMAERPQLAQYTR